MYRMGVIEESLENPDTLSALKPYYFSQRIAEKPDDEWPVWHINEYQIPDDQIAALLHVLEKQVKPTAYIHAFNNKELIVILRGKSFHISPHKDASWDEMITYGLSVGVGRNYLENIPLHV